MERQRWDEEGMPRTNDKLEGWHRGIYAMIQGPQPHIWKFVAAHQLQLHQLAFFFDRVRSPSYDVLSGTASDRFLKKIVLSAIQFAVIDRNGDIMHDLCQHMTTCDLLHCILTFQRTSEVTDLG